MQAIENIPLDFLHERGMNRERPLAEHEVASLVRAGTALQKVDRIVVLLGGKAGRLGECVVGSALLEGTLQALRLLGRAGVPVLVYVDAGIADLFVEQVYQEQYWPAITIVPTTRNLALQEISAAQPVTEHALILDFHGGHDGMPSLQIEQGPADTRRVTALAQLFRVGIRSYAHRGPERRYADFIEELFALRAGSLDGLQAQPHIRLREEERLHYPDLAQAYGLTSGALHIQCFFQSVVVAKCYERWDEVMQLLCEHLALHFPQQKIDFLLTCGPDEELPVGIRKADLEEWLQDFTGIQNNARVLIRSTPNLRDLAILTSQATMALTNDTGPGHIAGALGVPTITVFLPGNIYSKQIWSSTLWHHGITLEPNPYSYQQLEAAILWRHTDIINSVPPTAIAAEVIGNLIPRIQTTRQE